MDGGASLFKMGTEKKSPKVLISGKHERREKSSVN
jgi:hypothetical protein